jgi:hypothetical protein
MHFSIGIIRVESEAIHLPPSSLEIKVQIEKWKEIYHILAPKINTVKKLFFSPEYLRVINNTSLKSEGNFVSKFFGCFSLPFEKKS